MRSTRSSSRSRRVWLLAMGLLFTVAACSTSEANEDDESVVPEEEVAAEEVRTPAPAPEPEPRIVIAAGTSLTFSTGAELSTKSNKAGDQFEMTLLDDVLSGNGEVLVPAGTFGVGVVTASEKSPNSDDPAILNLELAYLLLDGEEIPMAGEVTGAEIQGDRKDDRTETAAKIGGGAAVGALVGGLLGGGDDVLKGAVIGAAAGTVLALTTKDGHANIPAGTLLTFELTNRVVVF